MEEIKLTAASFIKYIKREKVFINDYIIPWLHSIGGKSIKILHGPMEYGKDIIFQLSKGDSDITARDINTIACVVKCGNIKNYECYKNILYQIEQCFDEPYTREYDNKSIVIDECWVITNGDYTDEGKKYLWRMLKKQNLQYSVKIIDGNYLVKNSCSLNCGRMPISPEISCISPCDPIIKILELLEYSKDYNKTEKKEILQLFITQYRYYERLFKLELYPLYMQPKREYINILQEIKCVINNIKYILAKYNIINLHTPIIKAEEGNDKYYIKVLSKDALNIIITEIILNMYIYGNKKKMVIKLSNMHSKQGGKEINIKFIDYGKGLTYQIIKEIFEERYIDVYENEFEYQPYRNGIGLYVADKCAKYLDSKINIKNLKNPTEMELIINEI